MAGRLGATHRLGRRVGSGCAALLLILLSTSVPPSAKSASNEIDVALVLAVDASGSVDDDRFDLQKRGFAAALRSQRVLNAIRAGDHRAIAVLLVEWTGPPQQEVMVPWSYVSDEVSAGRAAAAIEAAPRH